MPGLTPARRIGPRLVRHVAAALAVLAATPPAAAAQFTSLTFFGDSFSDTGNGDLLAAALGVADPTPSPPYAPGVISNGPVWANYFAAAFSRAADAAPALPPVGARNYAIGTARTGLTGTAGLPIGMLAQLGLHDGISPVPGVSLGARAGDPTGLYSIFGGSNDVFDAAQLATPAAREAALQTAVGNLATLAQALYARGARRFLMPSLPDVGRSPAGLATAALLGTLTDRFNELLAARLGILGATLPGSTFYGLGLDTLFDNILLDAANGGTLYGFTNVTTPCLAPGATTCAGALFVDALHPTTAAHQLIAQAAFQRVAFGVDVVPAPSPIPGTTVPEPATIVLVAGGLVLLAGVRRRVARR